MGGPGVVAKTFQSEELAVIDPVVKVLGLSKSYGRQRAVRGVDLEVCAGEIYGLIGPDGAGKSSLMKAVAGVTTIDSGSIDVFGVRIDSEKAAEQIKDRTGFMPQGLGQNLYRELSVEENIDFFAHSRMVPDSAARERKERMLKMTRLAPFRDRPMKNLSGGMKQKLGLICTLIHEPRLVVLDEPTTGIDPVSRRDFWAILSLLLRERNITALVSTAYMDEASRFHRLSLFFDGRIVAGGTPEKILESVAGSVVAIETKRQVEAFWALKAKFAEVQARGARLRVFVEGLDPQEAAGGVRAALSSIGPEAATLSTGTPDLEDVFITLLREKKLLREEPPPAVPPTATGSSVRLPFSCSQDDELAIKAEELVRDFDGFRAVDRVSFQVAQGEIFGLLGANGAGKTTVIKMLVGLLPPTNGTGYVAGCEMLHSSRSIRERIGYMSQVFSLYSDLSVVENIRLYAGIYGLDGKQTRTRTEWIVEMAELAGHENHLTGGLPTGVRQRLALGCAMVHRPRILFLDEPTSGVDPVGRRRFWDILFRLSRLEGVAILITTHYMSEAEHCDHLALMHGGKIVADASPGEMKRGLQAEAGELLEVSTDAALDALDSLRKDGFEAAVLHGRQIRLFAPDRVQTEHRIRETLAGSGIRVLSVAEQPISMEEVFVYRILAMETNGSKPP
ncbi:MAG TPA: ATP-binding cassette domain-containing protein [Syntrophobacteraceae bacterium]|nr:ATP-binding cassette domain-containing protein [Syntrophobacteraceae bacterium]